MKWEERALVFVLHEHLRISHNWELRLSFLTYAMTCGGEIRLWKLVSQETKKTLETLFYSFIDWLRKLTFENGQGLVQCTRH